MKIYIKENTTHLVDSTTQSSISACLKKPCDGFRQGWRDIKLTLEK